MSAGPSLREQAHACFIVARYECLKPLKARSSEQDRMIEALKAAAATLERLARDGDSGCKPTTTR